MIRIIFTLSLFSFSIISAQDNDINSSSIKRDQSFKPYQITDNGLRMIAASGSYYESESIYMFGISYLRLISTKYDYLFLTSVGFMQEYGYSYWRNYSDGYHSVYAKFGVELGFFNQIYIDTYFGTYLSWWLPMPLAGIRARYIIEITKFLKLEIAASMNYVLTDKVIENQYINIGIILF